MPVHYKRGDGCALRIAKQEPKNLMQTMAGVNQLKPAPGFDQVSYRGQRSAQREKANEGQGVEIVNDIYDYLISDTMYQDAHDNNAPFAK